MISQVPITTTTESSWGWPGSIRHDILIEDNVIADLENVNLVTLCAQACFYDNRCESLTYNGVTKECRLNAAVFEQSGNIIPANDTIYISKGDITADEVS